MDCLQFTDVLPEDSLLPRTRPLCELLHISPTFTPL
jgi:hypothetical protein